jgi:sortase (surface protein transpeptidase)
VSAAPADTSSRPRFALRRWQIMTIGWSVPVALVAAYVSTNAVATTGQRELRDRWENAVAGGPVEAAVLANRTWRAGEPVARLAIPAIGLDLVVVEGGDGRRAPSHLASTAIPGIPGRAIVSGGRFGFGNFFLGLERLRPGDEIVVENLAGITRMVVVSTEVVAAERLGSGRDSAAPALDLITPTRAWRAGGRLIVHAEARSGENPQ